MNYTETFSIAGKDAHRVDGIEKVTGKAVYTGDIELAGMGYAKILRSPVAHARLLKVDASKAKELPRVIATLTRDDIKEFNYKYGATYKDQSIVAVDKVRYVGDPVAAVMAEDPATAEAALDLIEVEYEELPKVTNIEEAIAPGAIQVHEGDVARAELRGSTYGAPPRFNGTNICYYFAFKRYSITLSKRTSISPAMTARSSRYGPRARILSRCAIICREFFVSRSAGSESSCPTWVADTAGNCMSKRNRLPQP
jgi:hypothetical protein